MGKGHTLQRQFFLGIGIIVKTELSGVLSTIHPLKWTLHFKAVIIEFRLLELGRKGLKLSKRRKKNQFRL